MPTPQKPPSLLTPEQQKLWDETLKSINQNNVLCHCPRCHEEWVSSSPQPCSCGNTAIEWFLCWQFPDD